MATTNQQLVDEGVKRDKALQEKALAMIASAIALLDSSEAELRLILERYLAQLTAPGTDLSSPIVQLRLADMRREITELRSRYMGFVSDNLHQQAEEVARDEWAFLIATYAAVAGIQLLTPTGETVQEIVNTPFLGRDLDTWMTDLGASDANRISDAVVVGLIQGRSREDVLVASLGDEGLDGRNGATQITRNSLRSIIDSAVVSWASEAMADLLDINLNSERLPRELFVAVLDNRTTQICRELNGRVYRVGQGPYPPLHWNCRSRRIPLPESGEVPKVP